MRRSSPFVLAVLLALAATACGPSEEPADAPRAADPAEVDPAADAPADPQGYEALIGSADGITVIGADGTQTVVAFQTDQPDVLAALVPFLGEPLSDTLNEECPAGPTAAVEWANGLTLHFAADLDVRSLAGWHMHGDDERLQGPEGIQLGTPRDILGATPSVEMMEDSSLGDEFAVGAASDDGTVVGGLLEGPLVTDLYAGLNCFAR
ncbi:hypothetical protein [Rubrivirga sp. IMCC45206]|uniref:hypothetical protein n=1 Tax=Rubrivirga sp. IMCC45206 TaxID=3391614 RepID=UPI00398FF1AB